MSMRPGFPVALVDGTAVDTGVVLGGTVVRDVTGAPRAGVFPRGAAPAIVSARSDMKVDVAAFEGVATRTGQGVVFVANDATVQTSALPVPTSNSWIVVVWFRHDDAQSPNADADSLPVIGYTVGTASATPAKPSIDDGCEELATVLIPSTASATNSSGVVVTNTYQMTAMSGGAVYVRSAAEQNAFSAIDGQVIYRTDLMLYRQRVKESSTLVWVPCGEASIWVAGGTVNPIPTSEVTVPSTSKSFTLNAATRCFFHYSGLVQLNTPDPEYVDFHLRIDGVIVRSARSQRSDTNALEHKSTSGQIFETTLAAGSHTVDLRIYSSQTNVAVLTDPSWMMRMARTADPLTS